MRCFSLGLSLLFLSGTIAAAQTPLQRPAPRVLPPETVSRCQRAYASLQPSARNWVHTRAQSALKRHTLNLSELRSSALQRFPALRAGQNSDVLAMLVMVMTDAIQDTDEDKKYYLQKLTDMNTVAQALSNQINQLARATEDQAASSPGQRSKSDADPCVTPYCRSLSSRIADLNASLAHLPHPRHVQEPANSTYRDLKQLKSALQAQSNSLSDESQKLQADLQNAEQDYEQAVSLISDMMKEMSDTSMSMISNLK